MALTSKGHFKVNGTEYVAKSIKVDLESLASEDSGRTDDGVMHINWVLKKIRKVEIQVAPSTTANIAPLLSAVQGQTYSLTYFDPLANAEKTITAYTSTSSSELYSGVLYNGLWQGTSFNAIELGGEN